MKTTQTQEVLKHLQTAGDITSLEAINLYGCTRLSAIIFNLRKRGYAIATEDLECETRYGRTTRVAKYIYEGSAS